MGIESDLFHLATTSFGGIPSIAVLALPFVVGLIIGYIIRKALKIGIILLVVAIIASFLGFISLSSIVSEAKSFISQYGPTAQAYIAIFFGIIPLSIGLIIGIVIGFIV
jgi:hypothetical protein